MAFPWDTGILTRTSIYDPTTGIAAKVTADGKLIVDAQVTIPPVSAESSAKATAAPPTYVEGTTNPLSQDLAGGLRISSIQLPAALSDLGLLKVQNDAELMPKVTTYNYNGSGDIETIVVVRADGKTITDTFAYVGGVLQTITRTVV